MQVLRKLMMFNTVSVLKIINSLLRVSIRPMYRGVGKFLKAEAEYKRRGPRTEMGA